MWDAGTSLRGDYTATGRNNWAGGIMGGSSAGVQIARTFFLGSVLGQDFSTITEELPSVQSHMSNDLLLATQLVPSPRDASDFGPITAFKAKVIKVVTSSFWDDTLMGNLGSDGRGIAPHYRRRCRWLVPLVPRMTFAILEKAFSLKRISTRR